MRALRATSTPGRVRVRVRVRVVDAWDGHTWLGLELGLGLGFSDPNAVEWAALEAAGSSTRGIVAGQPVGRLSA
eukprot:scaffold64848_cov60-Phaeocystis_antarctica.AAC.1